MNLRAQLDRVSPMTERVYHAIVAYCRAHYIPPNYREIGAAVGLKSTSCVAYHVEILIWRGLLVRVGAGLSRAVVPAEIVGLVVREEVAA